jgi:hypothetical protein
MGLTSTKPDLISTTLMRLVAEGKWNPDSTDYNLIALPTEEARGRRPPA